MLSVLDLQLRSLLCLVFLRIYLLWNDVVGCKIYTDDFFSSPILCDRPFQGDYTLNLDLDFNNRVLRFAPQVLLPHWR